MTDPVAMTESRDMTREFVLGVDAGGTKTIAMIATTDGEVRSRQETGPGNPLRTGKQVAFANICDAIVGATRHAHIAPAEIGAAVIGMAGGGAEAMRADAARTLARDALVPTLRVVPDYQLVLPAAFPDGGVAVISGTGSIVHGVRDDQATRVGGRGYLIDDEGSGYWIGQQALRGVARSLDGRGPQTELTAAICQPLSNLSAADVLSDIHASPDRLARISAIAPIVVATADTDKVASDILRRCANLLAEMIQAACHNIGFHGDHYGLAVAGSVLTRTGHVRGLLIARLKELDLSPAQVSTVEAPVDGAIQLALNSLATG